MKLLAVFLTLGAILQGCATTYQPSGATGGYEDKLIEGNVYRVSFSANGYATRETAQTYWLYRAAELTLSKGFKSFKVLSDLRFASRLDRDQLVASTVYIPVPMSESHKPHIVGDILLLQEEVESKPPKFFNASELKDALEKYVRGEKCSMGNVCPHVKRYLGHSAQ